MFYQLRTYIIPEGRMPDIIRRFEMVTMDLFRKHGIEVVGFWTVDEPNPGRELVYVTRFENQQAADTAWEARAVRHTLACLLARVEGKSPLEYLTADEQRRQLKLCLNLMNDTPDTMPGLIEQIQYAYHNDP